MNDVQKVEQASNKKTGNLIVELAADHEDVLATQRLRYQIFAEELGADLESAMSGIDSDYYDQYCHHLLVRDVNTQQVVASTRILTCEQAEIAGSYYSQHEFDLSNLMPLPGRVMEIGRTCVHPDYRKGSASTVLWSGLVAFMSLHKYDYLMGCASIGMQDQGASLNAIMKSVRKKYFSKNSLRVMPHKKVPNTENVVAASPQVPPLFKAYLRLGAKVCGEPSWDESFNVADVFILLDLDDLNSPLQSLFYSEKCQETIAGHGR